MKIGIVGWGYVGATTGLGLRDKHEIFIYDPYKDVEEFSFNTIRDLPYKNMTNLKKINDMKDLSLVDVIFLCLPTPSNEDGSANLSFIENFLTDLNKALGDAIIVIRSTVPPGTTVNMQAKFPKFKFVHNPEFLKEKTPLHDFLYPSRIIIGGTNKEAVRRVMEIYEPFECMKIVTDSTSSEMIKYASNCFLANKISYFNEMHDICKKIGADPKVVAEAVSMDERIGRYGIYGGRPFGGSCLPKDLKALIHHVENKIDFEPHLLKAIKRVNDKVNA